jgi:hypothetical protein
MSVEQFMNQRVTLQRHTGVQVKPGATHGEAEPTYTNVTTEMYLEATGPAGRSPGREFRPDRNTPISEWFAMGKLSIDFSTWDQIVYNGSVLEIVSPPQLIYNPRTKRNSHWEMFLRQVDQP